MLQQVLVLNLLIISTANVNLVSTFPMGQQFPPLQPLPPPFINIDPSPQILHFIPASLAFPQPPPYAFLQPASIVPNNQKLGHVLEITYDEPQVRLIQQKNDNNKETSRIIGNPQVKKSKKSTVDYVIPINNMNDRQPPSFTFPQPVVHNIQKQGQVFEISIGEPQVRLVQQNKNDNRNSQENKSKKPVEKKSSVKKIGVNQINKSDEVFYYKFVVPSNVVQIVHDDAPVLNTKATVSVKNKKTDDIIN